MIHLSSSSVIGPPWKWKRTFCNACCCRNSEIISSHQAENREFKLMLNDKVNVMPTVINKPLLTPHQEIGLGQSSLFNRGCLIYRLYSSKGSEVLSEESWAAVSAAFPFFSFFWITLSIHASVDESANKEVQYKYWQPKERKDRLRLMPMMKARLVFFEPEMLHTLPCKRETKIYLTLELNTNKE